MDRSKPPVTPGGPFGSRPRRGSLRDRSSGLHAQGAAERATNEATKSADGTFGHAAESPDPSGPGDSIRRPNAVRNLTGGRSHPGDIPTGVTPAGGGHSLPRVSGENDPPTGGTNLPSRERSQVGENHMNIDKETKLRANTAPEQRLEETPTGESSDLLLGTVKQDSEWFLRSSVEEGGG